MNQTILLILLILLYIGLGPFLVMFLWTYSIFPIFGIATPSFLECLALLLLSRILFKSSSTKEQ